VSVVGEFRETLADISQGQHENRKERWRTHGTLGIRYRKLETQNERAEDGRQGVLSRCISTVARIDVVPDTRQRDGFQNTGRAILPEIKPHPQVDRLAKHKEEIVIPLRTKPWGGCDQLFRGMCICSVR
jgi:hypothetical protein